MKYCIVKDCLNKHLAKGFCKLHYDRNRRGKDLLDKQPEKHSMSKTSEYHIWQTMKQRCHNPKANKYPEYGGRGIKVCDKWRNSFTEFLKDMGLRPEGMSLDRIDNNGNYEPSNVRWATYEEQNINQRISKNNKSGVTGVSWSKKSDKWQVHFRGKYYGVFTTLEEAVQYRHSLFMKG